MILAGVVLASSVLTCAAEARGKATDGDRSWNGDGRIDGSNDTYRRGPDLRWRRGYHDMANRTYDSDGRHCYFPAEWPKPPPWPPFCN
ncbi:hypothetical protein AYJ54_40665 [Bradyrhizobium centrolobii]|uniref:Uncharacterized protein n=2 Tax=Bradyrhizobium centrolobii TaxID=1505087 RepID=A0A176Z540_9BRAD|nr:hypothetical protein AYJ54_40665 [Bradyrhizobium centrolobii]